jgi:hypothetical protein
MRLSVNHLHSARNAGRMKPAAGISNPPIKGREGFQNGPGIPGTLVDLVGMARFTVQKVTMTGARNDLRQNRGDHQEELRRTHHPAGNHHQHQSKA